MVTNVAVTTTTHPWTRRRASRDAQAPIRAAQPPATKSQRDARRCTARGPMWFQDLTDLGAFEQSPPQQSGCAVAFVRRATALCRAA